MKVTLTTGCFDILHPGHIELLKHAASYGHVVVVGINSDESIRRLKGAGRPVNDVAHRIAMLEALWMVGDVVVMDGDDAAKTILAVKPAIWLKGGDYTWDTLSKAERAACSEVEAEFVTMPKVEGYSTSGVVDRVAAAMQPEGRR